MGGHARETIPSITCWHPSTAWDSGGLPHAVSIYPGGCPPGSLAWWPLSKNCHLYPDASWMPVSSSDLRSGRPAFCITLEILSSPENYQTSTLASQQQLRSN